MKQRKKISIISIFLISIIFIVGLYRVPSAYAIMYLALDQYCMEPEEQILIQMINDHRAQNGIPPLHSSQMLGAAAENHSIDMAKTGFFDHKLSDGTTYSQNIANYGYDILHSYTGETITAGDASASKTFNAWKNSPSHNYIMLSSDFKAIGVGRDPIYQYYWTATYAGNILTNYIDPPAILCGGTSTPTPTITSLPTSTPQPGVTIVVTPTSTPIPKNTPVPTITPTPAPSDTTPPTVSITNPLNNATVAKRSKLTITATASDNIGITKVDFSVNGSLKCSSLLAPYSCVWKVPSGKTSSYTIEARAYDAANNTSSSTVSVTSQ